MATTAPTSIDYGTGIDGQIQKRVATQPTTPVFNPYLGGDNTGINGKQLANDTPLDISGGGYTGLAPQSTESNPFGITDPGQGPNKIPSTTPQPFDSTATKAQNSGVGVPNGDYQSWFMNLVAGKPYNQQTLRDLAPTLQANGVQLTPPNAMGEQTKIGIPDGNGGTTWVRVGFGEGHPVWIPQTGGTNSPNAMGSATMPSIFNSALGSQGSDLFNLLMGRAKQSLQINPNDPIIRNQTDAYGAQQTRAQRNYLTNLAETASTGNGGVSPNISAERRSSAEQVGQNTSAFQAQLMGGELAARRTEIQNALSGAAGLLTSQQQLALQEELHQLDLQQTAYQFDTNQQYLNSPLAG